MKKSSNFDSIVETIKVKASLKQAIYRNTLNAFLEFKKIAADIISSLEKEMDSFDKGVIINYQDKGSFEFQLKIGGDLILFQMHTNVFDFEGKHSMYKTSYLKEDSNRSYCGVINIFNFLADSIKYNRFEDSGYLIGRVFINSENHFFVEGRKKMNFIHNDFINESIDKSAIQNIIEHSIIYSMGFDLLVPPYQSVQEINVAQLIDDSSLLRVKTGKRMGFKFSFENE